MNNLQMGDTGENVIILQEKLKMLGLYNGIINGSFGLATQNGVKMLQRETGLVETGIVNSSTWEKLLSLTESPISSISNYPTLKKGATGKDVRELQNKLKALLYYPGEITGNFDLETENAVKRFQLNNKLTADGIVGSNTWNKINSLYGNLNNCVLENNPNNEPTGPTNPSPNNEYTVVSGDTLYSIARKFNTTVDAIMELNNLTSTTLQIGQILKIPTKANDNYIEYTVENGDTLYGIARRYNTTINAIKSLNNLTSDILQIGTVLKIPTSSNEDYENYTVKSGDTLYSIANKYGTSVATLKSLNNLTSDTLRIGQILKIPTTAGTNYITYIVKNGDTLYGIAKRYNTSVDILKNFNNLISNALKIGQALKIPV